MAAMSEGNGRATIREIAELAGVSIATVSRVVNGREDVSPATRELVHAIVRDRGYTTNRSARGLSAGRTGLIGATVPLVHAAYFSFLLSGAAEALYEQDMRLVLCPTMHEHDREVSLLERLMQGTTDGAVIILPEESSDELELLLKHGYRFVVIDPLLPLNERIPAVSAAHTAGADQAMKHLLSLGHTRIAAITGPRGMTVPDDLSIVGFDDLEEAEIVSPALTTIRQPLAEMGRIAVSLLIRLLDNQRLEALHVELGTRLVVRASTGPPSR